MSVRPPTQVCWVHMSCTYVRRRAPILVKHAMWQSASSRVCINSNTDSIIYCSHLRCIMYTCSMHKMYAYISINLQWYNYFCWVLPVRNISLVDAPPPKPKRPPKDLISKLTQKEQVEEVPLETKIRTRTASFLKSMLVHFPLICVGLYSRNQRIEYYSFQDSWIANFKVDILMSVLLCLGVRMRSGVYGSVCLSVCLCLWDCCCSMISKSFYR